MSHSNAGRGRGGILPNIRRRGAFFSNQGTVPFPGAPQPSTTAASASSTSGEEASGPSSSSGFAGSSSHPSSSSGPMGLTSRPDSSSGQMGPPSRPSSSGQMGPPSRPSSSGQMGPPSRPSSSDQMVPPSRPSSSSGSMGPPPHPSSSSGPARRPFVTSLDHMEFYDPLAPTRSGARIGPPRSGLSAPPPVSYGTGPPSAPSTYELIDSNARSSHPNLPAPAPVAPSPPAFRVPTDAISRFMELKQFMNRLQKATQDCDTLATNPFAHHLNITQVDYSEEFKLELAAFEEACSLLDQLIRREREVMDTLARTILPRTMRIAMIVRQEVFRLKTSPNTTLQGAVDSLMAVFRGLDQMFAERDVMTEEWVVLKDKWLSQGPSFL